MQKSFDLVEVKVNVEAIEERFAMRQIDRNLYDKSRLIHEKECLEIEQEINRSEGYF